MGFKDRQGSIECYGISLEQPLALPWGGIRKGFLEPMTYELRPEGWEGAAKQSEVRKLKPEKLSGLFMEGQARFSNPLAPSSYSFTEHVVGIS